MAWYIDSWAVLDGLAFASQRPADSLDAQATVFLSVPDLEPTPVGRISTALRAHRASFQDGFRDGAGNELAFETLDQVQEVVRRAYLGGGLGPAPVAVDPPPIDPLLREPERPPKWPKPPDGGAFFEAQLERLNTDDCIDYGALQDPDRRRQLFEMVHREGATRFYPYLRAFGEATLLEFVGERWDRLHHPEEREALSRWARLLIATGLWDDLHDFRHFVREAGIPQPALHLLRSDYLALEFGSFNFASAAPVASKGLLFRVPCPLRRDWDRHIRTLGHKLLLALVDRRYFAVNSHLPEFIPALFCGLVVAVNPALAVEPSPWLQSTDRDRLLGRALSWLAREMPNVTLPDAVEQQLSDFAWAQIEQNPAR